MQTKIRNLFRAVRKVATGIAVLAAGVHLGSANAGELDYGKPGQPIHLVVGYQPYYTESWSGMVMRGKEFWRKYLPRGSTVEFQVGLQGSIIVNAMLAGKQHIGYMGDMPAIVSTTKRRVGDVRIVATLGLAHDQCNIFLARNDAPQFNNANDAMRWLNGKQVAVPQGSCADRFGRAAFKASAVEPGSYMNQNIEVITSGFRARKIDAAVIWEPTASRLVQEGLAKRIASGWSVNEQDSAYLTMRADLIKQRPDVAKGWLNAELDAQLFLADPKNAAEVVRMAESQTTGFSSKSLWAALYGQYPVAQGGGPIRNSFVFAITPETMQLIDKATSFLYSIKSISTAKLEPDAVMPELAADVLKERGLTSPIGEIKAQPMSEAAF